MTKSGWVSAGILGSILWGCLSWQGWMSVVIYLLFGSLVTKIGFKFKKAQGIAEKRGGRRGPENVWGSAATGLFLAILTKLNAANFQIIVNLSEMLNDSGDIGELEYDIFKFKIKSLDTYEQNLIKVTK